MHSRKRKRSASPASLGTTVAKFQRTSPGPVAAAPPSASILQLRTLIWEWTPRRGPRTIQMGDTSGPTPLARYVAGPHGPVTTGAQWSIEHSAWVYTPEAPMSLRYTRMTFTGTASSDITYYGTIAGQHYGGDSIGPLLRLHRTGEPAFAATMPQPDDFFVHTEGAVGCGPGPPYDFFETDWLANEEADRTLESFIGSLDGALELCMPDLPGQDGEEEPVVVGYDPDDDEGKHVEPDAAKCNGWFGPWVAALLAKEEQKVDLGTRVEVQWEDGGRWGVEFEFKPISFEPYWPDPYADSGEESSTEPEDEGPNLAGYTGEATVRRVFVKPEWFDDEDEYCRSRQHPLLSARIS